MTLRPERKPPQHHRRGGTGRSRRIGVEIPCMRLTRPRLIGLRRAGTGAFAAAAVAAALVPASAAAHTSPVGAASVYGLDHNFRLVGHTDLAKRGMNSPIAVAGGTSIGCAPGGSCAIASCMRC